MVSDEAISSSFGDCFGPRKYAEHTCPPTRFASGTVVAGGARENALAKTSFMLRIAALSDVFLTKAQTHDSINTYFQ